jgi:hypothetical protein
MRISDCGVKHSSRIPGILRVRSDQFERILNGQRAKSMGFKILLYALTSTRCATRYRFRFDYESRIILLLPQLSQKFL